MKVAVMGGYGVFGERLCRLLTRDGHDVIVCGRSAATAAALADDVGARPLAIDREGDLAPLFDLCPEAVVDAAGPFQSYGEAPYRLAHACIDAGAHYLDLSDDAVFSSGIAALDGAARAAGVFALSGASSTPGLSSSVVAQLATGMSSVEAIDTAILPGNRAPRGRAVMESILGQVGAPLRLTRGGPDAPLAWTDPRAYHIAPGLRRRGWLIGSPETTLFPTRFNARSSTFRAGLELPIMNWGLAAIAALRRFGVVRSPARLVPVLRWIADRMRGFGTDDGGMFVSVVGRIDGEATVRRWTLLASDGEGPFIPAVVARAILRAPDRVPPGARPCASEVDLSDIAAAMADLSVTISENARPAPPLFERAIGSAWRELPPELADAHEVHDRRAYRGEARIERGAGAISRVIGALFRFPAAGTAVPVRVVMTKTVKGETWTREFGGRRFRSHISLRSDAGVTERFGPFAFDLDLPVREGRIVFELRRGRFFGLPMPSALLPVNETAERVESGAFAFDVGLSAPLGLGLIVRYRGRLEAEV